MKLPTHTNPENPLQEQKDGFQVPEGYFDDAKKRILAKTIYREKEINPDGFQIPENYFEKSREEIIEKTIGRQNHPTIKISWYQQPWFRIAASVIFLAGLTLLFSIPIKKSDTQITANTELSTEDIFAYVENNTDYSLTEIGYLAPNDFALPTTVEENYILNQADEQLLTEEL